MQTKFDCICVGSGPAGLMLSHILSKKGFRIAILEQRPSIGWRLLVAGSSGLNVSSGVSMEDFLNYYPLGQEHLKEALKNFQVKDWLNVLEELGEEPYLGTSGRYFIKSKTAAKLLQTWQSKLMGQGVMFFTNTELLDFESKEKIFIQAGDVTLKSKFLVFAAGGASWLEGPPAWANLLAKKGIFIEEFSSANCGYEILAPKTFFEQAEGKPIKGLRLKTKLGEKMGELMITKYGLEGTPVYTLGCVGEAILDLKPDMSVEKLQTRLDEVKGGLRKKLQYGAKLSEGAILLILALMEKDFSQESQRLAEKIKNFSIQLTKARPLSEAISSRGGVSLKEIDTDFRLKKISNVFCIGEMLAWDAPTGGFLIQACISMAAKAAERIEREIKSCKKA